MSSFKGYVLQSELARKAKVSNALFRQLLNIEFKKMGNLSCILKSSLPLKYRKVAENECMDLERYWSYAYLNKELGMSQHYLSQVARYMHIVAVKNGHIKLFELSQEFLENIKMGLIPFKIRTKDDLEHAKKIIKMQGLEIGFY